MYSYSFPTPIDYLRPGSLNESVLHQTPLFKKVFKNVMDENTKRERYAKMKEQYQLYLADMAYATALTKNYIVEQDKIAANYANFLQGARYKIRNDLKTGVKTTADIEQLAKDVKAIGTLGKINKQFGSPAYAPVNISYPTIPSYSGWTETAQRKSFETDYKSLPYTKVLSNLAEKLAG